MVLRYAGYSQDIQVSVPYYNKVKVLFQWKKKKIYIYPRLICFPLDNIVSFPAPAALCALVLMSQRMRKKKTEDKIQLLVKHSSGGEGGQREGENEGER